MRAIKIDSEHRTITEWKFDKINSLEVMQAVVEGYICQAFAHPDGKHYCFVNDDGLLNNPQHFFSFAIAKEGINIVATQPFAGNAIIVGMNAEGDTDNCDLDIDEVKNNVGWFTLKQVQAMIRDGKVDYNTYFIGKEGRKLIGRVDLGAFEQANEIETKTCANCGTNFSYMGALSRKDNKTEICSPCGEAEAIFDYLQSKKR